MGQTLEATGDKSRSTSSDKLRRETEAQFPGSAGSWLLPKGRDRAWVQGVHHLLPVLLSGEVCPGLGCGSRPQCLPAQRRLWLLVPSGLPWRRGLRTSPLPSSGNSPALARSGQSPARPSQLAAARGTQGRERNAGGHCPTRELVGHQERRRDWASSFFPDYTRDGKETPGEDPLNSPYLVTSSWELVRLTPLSLYSHHLNLSLFLTVRCVLGKLPVRWIKLYWRQGSGF